MTFEDFRSAASEPAGLPPLLRALWHDGRGDWETAHNITQDIDSPDAAWVHAYLHRKEGDPSNAAYWYRHAHRPVASDSLEQEWERLVRALLAGTD